MYKFLYFNNTKNSSKFTVVARRAINLWRFYSEKDKKGDKKGEINSLEKTSGSIKNQTQALKNQNVNLKFEPSKVLLASDKQRPSSVIDKKENSLKFSTEKNIEKPPKWLETSIKPTEPINLETNRTSNEGFKKNVKAQDTNNNITVTNVEQKHIDSVKIEPVIRSSKADVLSTGQSVKMPEEHCKEGKKKEDDKKSDACSTSDAGGSGKGDNGNSEDGCQCSQPYGAPSLCSAHPIGIKGRHCFSKEVESALNSQIEAELSAAYAYMSMACFFGNTQVSLRGMSAFFWAMHEEEMGHTRMFINYQNMRGGIVKLKPIKPPEVDGKWGCITKALEVGLAMEKLVKEKLMKLFEASEKAKDIGLSDFISGTCITDQDKSIREFAELLVKAMKFGKCGCTEHLFDEFLLKTYVKKDK